MYPAYSKWIQTYRELPLRLNQWCNVVRWEFKNPQPFLRTREFLWQEGHTAFYSKKESDKEVRDILHLYSRVYEELLAVPVVKGVKSEKEKFAGGLYTTTVEALIPTTGRAIQGATSHCLGQNFSKMFNIVVEDPEYATNPNSAEQITVVPPNKPSPPNAADIIQGPAPGKRYVWQNSWGLTTRTIGVMVMVHGDDKGLVLPPKVASVQVIVIPCGLESKATDEMRNQVNGQVESIVSLLKKSRVRVKSDMRPNYTAGWKYNHWELKGVPIRMEVGPKDCQKGEVRVVRRDNGSKMQVKVEGIASWTKEYLQTIQDDMLKKARETHNARIKKVEAWSDFVPALDGKNLVLIPWCEQVSCEEEIKEKSARVYIEP